MPNELVTAEEVASLLGDGFPPTDTHLVRLVDAVVTAARKRCGRQFAPFAADRIEYADGYGDDRIFLRESPIKALKEIRVDSAGIFGSDTIQTLTDFFFDIDVTRDDSRVWWRSGRFPEGKRVVMVKLDSGYDATGAANPKVPEDLRMVLIDEICARVKRGSSEKMKSESIGSYSYTRFDGAFSPDTIKVLNTYRRW